MTMVWWHHITALGGLTLTALMALAIAAWLGAARRRRLCALWCALFGAAMALVLASQLAFIGWGVGLRALAFAGFSGHAARAAAVYPVALFLLLEGEPLRLRRWGVASGVLAAVLIAVSRVLVGAHSASEAVFGAALGGSVAWLFIAQAGTTAHPAPRRRLLVGLGLVVVLLLPLPEPVNSAQWMTGLALGISGHDRPIVRAGWQAARSPYVPPCAQEKVRFRYMCT